jgi:hypothetical protein
MSEILRSHFSDDLPVRFVLGSVYTDPGSSSRDIGTLLFQSLAAVPIVLCGDITQNIQFVDFMKNTFNTDWATGTTLGSACLDLSFTRNISVECLNDISYIWYHRPV